jgi:hypothetical protein
LVTVETTVSELAPLKLFSDIPEKTTVRSCPKGEFNEAPFDRGDERYAAAVQ